MEQNGLYRYFFLAEVWGAVIDVVLFSNPVNNYFCVVMLVLFLVYFGFWVFDRLGIARKFRYVFNT